MKTLTDLFVSVAKADSARMVAVNAGLMKAAISNKTRPGFIQVALSDVDVQGFMLGGKTIGLMVLIDREEYEKIVADLLEDKELPQSENRTADDIQL
ncbi:hypothetical protein P4H71_08845 [Paenibacillus kribbensis]|uniref:hypothetical protein n=1 Tax=Paenibacillus kribbensis TaxID=172713 RepID=UPI002DBCEE02|nr:hypothetical protein [Paenibacillus kribbensis]MEC0234431.1 hypothetical protein [Paenibacillus kribbensis]